MALTKISTAMISQSAAAVDLNVDAGTFYVDTTNNRVGVGGKTDPDTPLHVIGTATATTFAGSGASLTDIPNSALTNSSITINSTVVSLGGSLTLTTANIAENTNLYYTDARADARIAAADTDDLSEGSSNLYYTDARVDARVSGGSLGNITTTGYIRGPATFTLDPAAHGDDTGTVVIAGNLQVDGTTTTINSTTLTVDDKNITLASGSANAAAADGAGFTVDIGTGTLPAITYDGTNDEWDFNKPLNVQTNLLLSSDGSNSIISESGAGGLFLRGSSISVQNSSNANMIQALSAGAVTLYHNGAPKIATSSSGASITGIVNVTGNIVVSGTVDGVDIAARDAVLTSTTTTAGAALPKAGGTMTGTLAMGANAITSTGTVSSGAITSTGILTLDTSPAANGTGDLVIIPSLSSASGVGFAGQIFGVNIANAVHSQHNAPAVSNTWGGVTGATAIAIQADDNSYGQFQVWTAPQDSSAADLLTPKFYIAGSGNATFTGTLSSGAITTNNNFNMTGGYSVYLGSTSRFSSDNNGSFGINYGTTGGTATGSLVIYNNTTATSQLNRNGTISSNINGNNTVGGNIVLGPSSGSSKWYAITGRQYDSGTETEGYSLITGATSSGVNDVTIGGGLDEQNAATKVMIKAAANSTTRNGTEVVRVTTDGLDVRNSVLRITGTTVIDSSRNLTNIASIDLPNANNWSYIKNNTASGGLRFGTKNATGTYSDQIEISATGNYVKLNRNTTVTGEMSATNYKVGTTQIVTSGRSIQNIVNYTGSGEIQISGNLQATHVYNSGSYYVLNAAGNGWNTIVNRGTGDNFTVNAVGGYQMAGTTVIDSSRNLTNIGTATLSSTTSTLLTLNPTANNYGGISFQYGGVSKGFSGYNSGMMVYGGESDVSTTLQAGGQYGLFIHHNTRNVGIGTGTSAPSYKLQVTGTLGVSGTTTLADLIIGTQLNFNGATNSSFIGAASTVNIRYAADGYHRFDTYNGGWGERVQITDTGCHPATDNTYDLGTTTLRWRNVYTTDLHLSNEGKPEGNEVDGTTGNWTIQEGAENLYILNNKTGKKYKFALEEIT